MFGSSQQHLLPHHHVGGLMLTGDVCHLSLDVLTNLFQLFFCHIFVFVFVFFKKPAVRFGAIGITPFPLAGFRL